MSQPNHSADALRVGLPKGHMQDAVLTLLADAVEALDPVQVVAAAPVGLFRDGVPAAVPTPITAGLHGDPDIEVELAEFSVRVLRRRDGLSRSRGRRLSPRREQIPRDRWVIITAMLLNVLVIAVQLQIPAPQGYVNDFAGVIDARLESAMAALITEVQQKTGGEIVVVTLLDLEGRASIDVARDIGRQWRVGAERRAGSRASNAGVVLLLVPGGRPGDGRADLAISTGRGAEGFITDAETLRIRDAIGEAATRSGSYAEGLAVGVQLLAREYAEEFGVTLTGQAARPVPRRQPSGRTGGSYSWLLLLAVFFIFGRRGSGRWLLLAMLLGGGRGGHYHGGFGGGGFGGGGFGGFGGGGGFSGGGSSGGF